MLHRKGQKKYCTDLSLLGQEPTFKTPIMTASVDIHKYFFIVVFSEKYDNISSSARQHQALFSLKDKTKKKKKVSSAAIFVWHFKG